VNGLETFSGRSCLDASDPGTAEPSAAASEQEATNAVRTWMRDAIAGR